MMSVFRTFALLALMAAVPFAMVELVLTEVEEIAQPEPTTTTTVVTQPEPTTVEPEPTTTTTTVDTTVHTNPPDYVDPDIAWAAEVGPELRARVLGAVDRFLAEPDLGIPACWEDEALVVVITHAHPNHPALGDQVGMLGCVPMDDLPVSGYRPEQ